MHFTNVTALGGEVLLVVYGKGKARNAACAANVNKIVNTRRKIECVLDRIQSKERNLDSKGEGEGGNGGDA